MFPIQNHTLTIRQVPPNPYINMDIVWSPVATWPEKLYRVHYPRQQTRLLPREGYVACGPIKSQGGQLGDTASFFLSIANHRDQVTIPSPWISTFEDKGEAEMWALAGEKIYEQTCYILEITTALLHPEYPIFKVSDIQDQTKLPLGYSGQRNSEWLVPNNVPARAINQNFKSTDAIKGEMSQNLRKELVGLPLKSPCPENDWFKTTPSQPASVFDFLNGPAPRSKTIFKLPSYKEVLEENPENKKLLKCGCFGEKHCSHFEWPTEEDDDKDFGPLF